MEAKTIQLEGVNRNLPGKTSPDGVCQEIINSRFWEGAWRPIGKKEQWKSFTNTGQVARSYFIHNINPDRYAVVYAAISGASISVVAMIYNSADALVQNQTITSSGIGGDVKFSSMGNTLIIMDRTNSQIHMAVFSPELDTYDYTSSYQPPRLDISFSSSADSGGDEVVTTADEEPETILGDALKLQSEKATAGYYTGTAWFVYAFEMYDGSLMKHSIPKFATGGLFNSTNTALTYWAYSHHYTIQSAAAIINEIKEYSHLIKNVNIYVALMPEITKYVGSDPTYHDPVVHNWSIDALNAFFRVAQIPVDELSNGATAQIEFGDLNDLATREAMTGDDFTNHTLSAKNLFAYNSRIFLGDIIVTLADPEISSSIVSAPAGGTTGAAYNMYAEVEILTEDGSRWVRQLLGSFDHYVSTTRTVFINSYFGYNDRRARKVRLLFESGGTYYLAWEGPLTSHEFFNFSYTLPPGEIADLGTTTINTVDKTYEAQNRIQASALSNPFHFPAANSYRAGHGRVLGMQSNALPVSQGQFGSYPVYVFSTDGVYAMNFSQDPDVLIDSVSPVDDRICNNDESITPVMGGVLFSATDGLYVISGGEVREISELVEGSVGSPLDGGIDYDNWIDNPLHYQITDLISSVRFKEYALGAVLGYDDDHKEIIVSNSTYNYSYVYSLKYGLWYKVGDSWDGFLTRFPDTYGYKVGASDVFYDLSQEDGSTATRYVPVHIETRPIKLTPGFKKIDAAVLRGFCNPIGDKGYGFLVFGSTDGKKFRLIAGRKPMGESYDIELHKTAYSVREIIIVAGGEIDVDSFITHFDFGFTPTFGNKLR